MKLETPEQAKELCIKAHAGQYRRATIVNTDSWDCYKLKQEQVMPNGDLVQYIHGDQFRVQQPFHAHPIAVADMMSTPYRKMLAYLHDVIEDTPYTLEMVPLMNGSKYYIESENEHGHIEISEDLYTDLGLLTKDPNLTYEQNIRRIKDSGRADPIAVKIADNTHSLSTATPKQQQKYLDISLPILLGE